MIPALVPNIPALCWPVPLHHLGICRDKENHMVELFFHPGEKLGSLLWFQWYPRYSAPLSLPLRVAPPSQRPARETAPIQHPDISLKKLWRVPCTMLQPGKCTRGG